MLDNASMKVEVLIADQCKTEINGDRLPDNVNMQVEENTLPKQ